MLIVIVIHNEDEILLLPSCQHLTISFGVLCVRTFVVVWARRVSNSDGSSGRGAMRIPIDLIPNPGFDRDATFTTPTTQQAHSTRILVELLGQALLYSEVEAH